MRYGFCTGLASSLKDDIDYRLLQKIKAAGYDYVEFPLMLLEGLSEKRFDTLVGALDRLKLDCDCCCDMFPRSIQIVGSGVSYAVLEPYLQRIFARAAALGTEKIVLGSAYSRNLPEGYDVDRGYEQLADLIVQCILPITVGHGMHVVIEPIRSAVCNFINLLPEGMRLVDRVASPHVTLMADTIHMLSEGEDPDHIRAYRGYLDHVHVSELGRVLPEEGFSRGVGDILDRLKEEGYDKTVSFETKPGNLNKSLNLLKRKFG